jgi:hypothetical protein
MKAHIFAEGSNTTAEVRTKPAKEYFQGLFGMVAGLTDELSELADTTLHILSEEFGVVEGEQLISDAESADEQSDDVWGSACEELFAAAKEADVMVVLLSTATFEKTAVDIWPKLVDEAKPDSIWCIGAAQSVLDSLGLEKLEEKGCSAITYRRVGVARIGTETREELLKSVSKKGSE